MTTRKDWNIVHDAITSAIVIDNFPLNEHTVLKNIPGWDSLTHIRFIVEVENLAGISFDVESIIGIESLGDVCRVLEKHRLNTTF